MLNQVVEDDRNHHLGMIGQHQRRQHQARAIIVHAQAEHQRRLLGPVHLQQTGHHPARHEREGTQAGAIARIAIRKSQSGFAIAFGSEIDAFE